MYQFVSLVNYIVRYYSMALWENTYFDTEQNNCQTFSACRSKALTNSNCRYANVGIGISL